MEAPHAEWVSRGVYRLALRTPTLPPATHTNCFLVGEHDFVVVEPGSPWPGEQSRLDAAIRERMAQGHRVVGAVVTHHHRDHAGGVKAFRIRYGVPVLVHPNTRERLAHSGVEVDAEIEPGSALPEPLAALGIEVVFTPGHAPGHLCLSAPDGWIIVGDMLASVGTVIIDPDDGGDMTEYLRSLDELERRAARLLLPAHGQPIERALEKITEYRQHRHAREELVLSALGNTWVDAPSAVSKAYADTPKVLWPLALKSARAHLARLETLGLAVGRGDGPSRQWQRTDRKRKRDDG